MKILPAFVAVISGVILCNLIIYVTGYLAAITIPKEYFLWFGKAHITMSLIILDAIIIALPRLITTTFFCICTILILRQHYLFTLLWCFAGYILAQAYWDFKFNLDFDYMTLFVQQPWAILSIIAPPCGILLAGIFFNKFHRVKALAI